MFTRRAWLTGLAASANLPAAPKVKIGAHLWVFAARQPGFDPTPVLDEVFGQLAQARVDGLELMHHVLLHDGQVERIKELAKRHKLPVIGSSWSAAMWDVSQRPAIVAQGRTVITRLHQVGGTYLGVSVGDARRKKTEAELDAQGETLRTICRMAREEGVVTNVHNHTYEVRDGEWDLRNTLERVPEARLGPDFGWLYRAGVNPVDFIKRYGRRIVYGHLRNELANGKWPETLAEGVIDYAAIAGALRDAGFNGALAIELAHEPGFTPTQPIGMSFRQSREYVKRTMRW